MADGFVVCGYAHNYHSLYRTYTQYCRLHGNAYAAYDRNNIPITRTFVC
jgi:hypothetical protein